MIPLPTDEADLKMVGLILDEPGMRVIERSLKEYRNEVDKVSKLQQAGGSLEFSIGQAIGEVNAYEKMLKFFVDMRKKIHKDLQEE